LKSIPDEELEEVIQTAIENISEEVPELPVVEEEIIPPTKLTQQMSNISIREKPISTTIATPIAQQPVKQLQKAVSEAGVSKREAIAREIYETEKSYVNSLMKLEQVKSVMKAKVLIILVVVSSTFRSYRIRKAYYHHG
jgi:hypothetical protein